MILAVAVAIPDRFARGLGNIGSPPEFDGLVSNLILDVGAEYFDLP